MVNTTHMTSSSKGNRAKSLTPRTSTGWIAVALGFGVVVVGWLLFIVSNTVTNDGAQAAPLWLRAAVPASVLAIAIPAVITGFRSRRTDPSPLGTIALVIACVLGAWTAITAVAGIFL